MLVILFDDFLDFSVCVDIYVSLDGYYFYVFNCGYNSLAIYCIQVENGQLEYLGWVFIQGDFFCNFMIIEDGSQLFVVNQNSDNIVIFDCDLVFGQFIWQVVIDCFIFVCIKFVEL